MLMRYHWSLGIGHTYAHAQPSQTDIFWPSGPDLVGNDSTSGVTNGVDPTVGRDGQDQGPATQPPDCDKEPDPDDPQLALEDRETEDLGPSDLHHNGDDDVEPPTELDDELYLMYNI